MESFLAFGGKKGTKVIQSKASNAKIMNDIVIIQMKSFINMLCYRNQEMSTWRVPTLKTIITIHPQVESIKIEKSSKYSLCYRTKI